MQNESLDKFFNPETIAVIGASDRAHSVGGAIFSNIKNSAFAGRLFPVNNKNAVVQGQKAFPSIGDIGEKIDLAVIAAPAAAVLPVLDDCARAGAGGAVIVSSGFKESGKQGKKDFAAIRKLAQTSGMRILGPNCLGFANPRAELNASFAPQSPLPGSIAFISQSGALCGTLLDWSLRDNIGFSHFVSIGSAADIDFAEMIELFFPRQKRRQHPALYGISKRRAALHRRGARILPNQTDRLFESRRQFRGRRGGGFAHRRDRRRRTKFFRRFLKAPE